jgi:aminoglycoside 6'-N-acetyltransferase
MQLDLHPAETRGVAACAYGFRPLAEHDLPIIWRWLRTEHVAEWWPDAPGSLENIARHIGEPEIDPYVVEFDGRPIGYIQCYDAHAGWTLEGACDQPVGTCGIDQFIGEADMVGRGHGPRFISAFCDKLFDAAAPRTITDPAPTNIRAVRAYAKAGFRALRETRGPDGQVLLMAKDRAG